MKHSADSMRRIRNDPWRMMWDRTEKIEVIMVRKHLWDGREVSVIGLGSGEFGGKCPEALARVLPLVTRLAEAAPL